MDLRSDSQDLHIPQQEVGRAAKRFRAFCGRSTSLERPIRLEVMGGPRISEETDIYSCIDHMKLTESVRKAEACRLIPSLELRSSITQKKEKKRMGGNFESISVFTVNQHLSVL